MPVVFPSNDKFIPLTRNGNFYENPAFNENPASVDIVGSLEYPAIYFATDDTNAFFRFRLRGTPLLGSGFDNFAWIILFDTNMNLTDSYEWELALRGNSNDVVLIENLVKNSPGSGFNDKAEGIPISFPITSYDIVRAIPANSMIGGIQNYFLDISIDLTILKNTLGINAESLLRFNFFTSANEINFNKDKMCAEADFDKCFSDFFTLATILKGKILNKENGSPICNAKIELFQNGNSIAATYTDPEGNYIFDNLTSGDYYIKITKCCYLPIFNCNQIAIKENQTNIYNFSLAPDCICSIKCNIIEAEKELIAEKMRVYKIVSDYLISLTFSPDNLWNYTQLLCILNNGTSELDCCIANVLETLQICMGGDQNE